jgi:subfamily B ATP-binding cassette protein MsbA
MTADRPFLIYRRLLSYLRGSHLRIVIVLAALVAHALGSLLVPWLIKDLYRDTTLAHEWQGISAALGLILGVMLVIAGARYLTDDQLEVVSLRLMERLRNEVVAKLARLPVRHFVHERTGNAVSRAFNDVQALSTFLHHACVALGSDLLRMAGSVGMLFVLNARLALIAAAMAFLGGGLVALTARWVRRRFHRVHRLLADMTGLLTEQVSAMPTIQAYGAAEFERRRFADRARLHFREALLGNRCHGGSQALLSGLGAVGIVVLLALGTSEAISAGGTGGSGPALERLFGFTLYAALLAGPLTRLGRTNFEIQQSLAAARHLFELLDLPEEEHDGNRGIVVRPRGEVRLESVSFHYRPDEPVLSGIDLVIRPGETVAVVGRSGAGKSTLMYLLLRFYEPTSGRVLLDGHALRELRRADLRQHIGWLGQDPFILSGTIAENIRYGCWDAGEEEMERAARLACADTFIYELPEGYQTRVGERGLDLSGGQRARLALARVILRSPAIVLLDEATAALDTETETRLWRGLEGWLAERTTIIIAHRLLTVLGRPRIVVLDAGRIVGDGTAAHLRHNCPSFNRLFLEQMNLVPRAA